ncbi:hypothetical protein ACQP3C_27505, partial [Escherichia coli]
MAELIGDKRSGFLTGTFFSRQLTSLISSQTQKPDSHSFSGLLGGAHCPSSLQFCVLPADLEPMGQEGAVTS